MQPRTLADLGGAALQTSTYESKSGPFRAAWRRESDNAALKAPLFHGGTADRDIRATDVTCGFEGFQNCHTETDTFQQQLSSLCRVR
jgi:hypothetical protein